MKKIFTRKLHFLFLFVGLISYGAKAEHLRIASLVPSVTKNIYALESQGQLVACTKFCSDGVRDGKEIVADAVDVNIEKLISLEPDVVIASTLTPTETIDMLKVFGIRVELYRTPKSFREIGSEFIRLGILTGMEDLAVKMVETFESKVDSLLKSMPKHKGEKIFFQIGSDPIFTVLPNTFMNDFITLTGASNIAEDMERGSISREFVISRNPDFIFIASMGVLGQEEKQTWMNYQGMSAADESNIFIVDAEKACLPTPETFVETLETLVKQMQENEQH